ncbi:MULTISPECIES: GNAT family N-acetyltransferase [Clostridium]|uniref:N-acetyltransferase n=1 Tax=Clostridium cadaveris TaxID=1529 RepID=A0A1I2PL23_9CLOT|nr:GNAT family N-acetyltransferase [Clostridium cadaveris]MDU4953215.1 GNAT family N-acetyltransferase [Clostridium sp.]MDM8311747.1 GNAT family N-acetyltransferase [Clostridium cadaveris]MDY4947981.1 GNAT family N-acetyltransferase [Clostridium cadaveris]NME65980.1 GNAT family N-acetyltransferase [Clostridium cadaveris]NWK09718.1 GNAT family N-acetyltransferase [Clostridium cadaveris]
MKHKGTKYIETERLILRPFTMEDTSAMYKNWASDEDVTKFLMWPAHKDVSISENVLKEWTKNYQDMSYYQWAIVFKQYSNEPIGSIGVNNSIDETIQMAHIGYCIGKKWWHMGITSEALKLVMEYLFDEVGINRVESRHDPRNHNSGEVMKKCGMKYEGTLRAADWNNQGVCDASYYALLASER